MKATLCDHWFIRKIHSFHRSCLLFYWQLQSWTTFLYHWPFWDCPNARQMPKIYIAGQCPHELTWAYSRISKMKLSAVSILLSVGLRETKRLADPTQLLSFPEGNHLPRYCGRPFLLQYSMLDSSQNLRHKLSVTAHLSTVTLILWQVWRGLTTRLDRKAMHNSANCLSAHSKPARSIALAIKTQAAGSHRLSKYSIAHTTDDKSRSYWVRYMHSTRVETQISVLLSTVCRSNTISVQNIQLKNARHW